MAGTNGIVLTPCGGRGGPRSRRKGLVSRLRVNYERLLGIWNWLTGRLLGHRAASGRSADVMHSIAE